MTKEEFIFEEIKNCNSFYPSKHLDRGDLKTTRICLFCNNAIYTVDKYTQEQIETDLWKYLMHEQCFRAWAIFPTLDFLKE